MAKCGSVERRAGVPEGKKQGFCVKDCTDAPASPISSAKRNQVDDSTSGNHIYYSKCVSWLWDFVV